MRTLRQIKVALVPVLTAAACYVGAATTVGCSAANTQSKAETPVSNTAQASSATSDVTQISSFAVSSQQGSLSLSARDASGAEIAKFNVTKAPLVKYSGGVLPVIMVDETGKGGAIHAESASVYPYRDDLSRTELELFGVGDDNLIIRWAYDSDGILTRVSLFAYHASIAQGSPRLEKFMANPLNTVAPFDLPQNYASVDEYLDAWIDASNLDAVFNSDELDNVFFTLRDPTWLQAVVSAVDPSEGTTAQDVNVNDDGLAIENTGGGGGGSKGSTGKSSGSSKPGTGKTKSSGTGSKASSSGTSKGKKSGQVNGCDTSSIGGFLSGVLGNVAKNPTGAVTGAKACSECVSGLTSGNAAAKSGDGTSGTANTSASPTSPGATQGATKTGTSTGKSGSTAKKSKTSNTKTALANTAKTVKKPKATASSSNACGSCQKFLSNTGVTKAATCLIGKVTNGSLGKSKSGTASNSKGNSPADDMSDECTDDTSCDDASDGNTCTMGTDTCDFDDDQDADDSGNFDLGDVGDGSDGISGDFGDFDED